MKKHILMVTVVSLFFCAQVNAMDQKEKESLFRDFLHRTIFRPTDVPAGANPAQYLKEKMRDGAKLYGLQPELARRIYSDLMVNFRVADKYNLTPTDPNFDEIKAQFKKDHGPRIDAAAREIFP
jgi:hypothetical protein